MPKAATPTVIAFGRERKSLRSAAAAKKSVVVDDSENVQDENLPTTPVKRRGSRTPATPLREPITQLQTKSPAKKGQARVAMSTSSSVRSKLETSPAKSIVQAISQSTTPKKQLCFDDAKPVTPKKVSEDLAAAKQKSPKKSLFRQDVSRFASARKALSTALPDTLVGRASQIEQMRRFLESNMRPTQATASKSCPKNNKKTKQQQPEQTPQNEEAVKRSLYVSGPPGTGKTTCLKHLLANLPESASEQLTCAFINCMALGSSAKVFTKVAELLLPAGKRHLIGGGGETKKLLEEEIVSSKKWILLVLDEIDQLESKCQEVLYTLFEWPYLNNSKLILVGIANALDLTDRILPRITLRSSFAPAEINFPAYSRDEINNIITTRLKEFNTDTDQPVIKPAAISFLSGKISALSGDVRKALDVCRRAIELSEVEVRKQTLLKPIEPAGAVNNRTSPALKSIDVPQILKIWSEVYLSSVTSSMGQKNSDLPLHQKLLMASLLLMTCQGRKVKEVTMAKLHETYSKVCKKRNMTSAGLSETVTMASLLESRGFVGVKSAKQVKDSKLSLRIDEDEIEAALQDKTLLSGILHDVECISY